MTEGAYGEVKVCVMQVAPKPSMSEIIMVKPVEAMEQLPVGFWLDVGTWGDEKLTGNGTWDKNFNKSHKHFDTICDAVIPGYREYFTNQIFVVDDIKFIGKFEYPRGPHYYLWDDARGCWQSVATFTVTWKLSRPEVSGHDEQVARQEFLKVRTQITNKWNALRKATRLRVGIDDALNARAQSMVDETNAYMELSVNFLELKEKVDSAIESMNAGLYSKTDLRIMRNYLKNFSSTILNHSAKLPSAKQTKARKKKLRK